ncbi:MAG: CIA30 family protein [Actinomycetota bacterium]
MRRSSMLLGATLVVAACGSDGADDSAGPGGDDVPVTTADTIESTSATPTTTTPTGTPAPALASSTTSAATTTATTMTTMTATNGAPASVSGAIDEPGPGCTRLTHFADGDANDGWFVVDDGVMGGRSAGAAEIADSLLRFDGEVVTAGGGFTSVRFRLVGDELAETERVELRLRTDERTYGLTFEDESEFRGRRVSHGADLTIDGDPDDDGFHVVTLDYEQLRPTVFGQAVDSAPFDPDLASEIGIIIGDGLDGPFRLDIDRIDACM